MDLKHEDHLELSLSMIGTSWEEVVDRGRRAMAWTVGCERSARRPLSMCEPCGDINKCYGHRVGLKPYHKTCAAHQSCRRRTLRHRLMLSRVARIQIDMTRTAILSYLRSRKHAIFGCVHYCLTILFFLCVSRSLYIPFLAQFSILFLNVFTIASVQWPCTARVPTRRARKGFERIDTVLDQPAIWPACCSGIHWRPYICYSADCHTTSRIQSV